MNTERANPFDVAGFEPKAEKKSSVPTEQIDKLAAETGFVSRSPKPAPEPVVQHEVARPRRRRSARNHQVNIRATAEALDLLAQLSDELDQPFGEVLERALRALRRETKPKAK
jgi:hypothetical protein